MRYKKCKLIERISTVFLFGQTKEFEKVKTEQVRRLEEL